MGSSVPQIGFFFLRSELATLRSSALDWIYRQVVACDAVAEDDPRTHLEAALAIQVRTANSTSLSRQSSTR
jgi:hypothetical protein